MTLCKECNGQGKYTIRNAYKPDFKKELVCEYCEGRGAIKSLDKKDDVLN